MPTDDGLSLWTTEERAKQAHDARTAATTANATTSIMDGAAAATSAAVAATNTGRKKRQRNIGNPTPTEEPLQLRIKKEPGS